jgi:Glycosyl transferase family 11
MIIINLMGGLGNQMFQYATAKNLSLMNNTELTIDASNFRKLTSNSEHTFQLSNFNISARQASKLEIWKIAQPTNSLARIVGEVFGRSAHKAKAVFKEPDGSDFKPDVLTIKSDRLLIGYFNSYKYFDSIRSILVHEYTPREEISAEGQNLLKLIASTNSVSIHIRRGDYVADPEVYKCIEGIITERFYQNAVDYIASRVDSPHFFVFSNDMPWVKQNFRVHNKITYVDFNSPQRGFEDLWLMSRCKHNITAGGSTFSWWAAYLNHNKNKIIVRTENISNDPKYNYPDDYFPPDWKTVVS